MSDHRKRIEDYMQRYGIVTDDDIAGDLGLCIGTVRRTLCCMLAEGKARNDMTKSNRQAWIIIRKA